MKKRIEFFFDENSITESTDAEIEAVVTLHDGSVIILPKAHCVIECAPTKHAADGLVCPRCLASYDIEKGCSKCGYLFVARR